jgi:hypothetical protein
MTALHSLRMLIQKDEALHTLHGSLATMGRSKAALLLLTLASEVSR